MPHCLQRRFRNPLGSIVRIQVGLNDGRLRAALFLDLVGQLFEQLDATRHHRDLHAFRRQSFRNRAAESLAETDQQSRTAPPPAVAPIAPGASDGYRMLFLDRELPPFHHTRVVVSRVY